jgi:hypothetical protein
LSEEFIYFSLFNNDVSNLNCIALNDWITANNESKRMWKEAVMASFKVLSWHLPGGAEKKHENSDSG